MLWDIDGTLIRNTVSAGNLYIDSIQHLTGSHPSVPVAHPHGMTEGQLLTAIGLDEVVAQIQRSATR